MRTLLQEVVDSVLTSAVKKKLFGKSKLLFRRYLGCYQESFELGVVIGYAYRAEIVKLLRLFSQPGHEVELTDFIQGLAKEKLTTLQKDSGFFGIAMFAEEERIRATWRNADTTLSEARLDATKDNVEIPIDTAYGNLQVAVSSGIGFGSAFPELTERLWATEHETPIDPDKLKRLIDAGLDVPAEPEPPVTLPNRAAALRHSVERFVARYRPALRSEFGCGPTG